MLSLLYRVMNCVLLVKANFFLTSFNIKYANTKLQSKMVHFYSRKFNNHHDFSSFTTKINHLLKLSIDKV